MFRSIVKETNINEFLRRCQEKEAQGYEAVAPFKRTCTFQKDFKSDKYGTAFLRTDEVFYYEIVYKRSRDYGKESNTAKEV